MAILQERPPFNRCTTAQQLTALGNNRFVRIAGVVTGKQRPGTAYGVIFMTLEDETGNHNVVIWKDLQSRYRQTLLTGKILLIKGVVETSDGVTHVIAGHIENHIHALEFASNSRDFH